MKFFRVYIAFFKVWFLNLFNENKQIQRAQLESQSPVRESAEQKTLEIPPEVTSQMAKLTILD